MSSETAVNGQRVVSTSTRISSTETSEFATEEVTTTTTTTVVAKSDQASTLMQLNLLNSNYDCDGDDDDDDAVDAEANANADVIAKVDVHSPSAKANSKVSASRKRSRQRNGDDSLKRRNSKNCPDAGAASNQIRRVVDDFDSLFDEIRANDVDDLAVQQSRHVLTSSDAYTNNLQAQAETADFGAGLCADAEVNGNGNANATAVTNNAFVVGQSHQKRQEDVVSSASDSLTGDAINSNAIDHRQSTADAADQRVPYYTRNSTNTRNDATTTTTSTFCSENTSASVEKSLSSSSASCTFEQSSLIEECRYNIPDNVIKDVVRESKYATTTAEKKITRKKKTVSAATATVSNTGNNSTTSTASATTNSTTSSTTHSCTSNGVAAAATPKVKKSKKGKKHSDEKENISVRSGFGKFDQLTKKTLLHVRSQDSSRAQQHFSQGENGVAENAGNVCKACNKNVFAMELIKAERAFWHRNCFRCSTCSKQLTVDIYSSHEGKLYCKPHFKDLFKPKVVVEDEKPVKLKKPELIIRENQPLELPPDVVRASDKPDLGLDELSNLNVKSRFQVFEKQNTTEESESAVDRATVSVKRSPSIMSKLAKFQAKGMDVGVSSDIFNGIDYEESDSSQDEENEANTNENSGIAKNVVSREKPMAFNKMNDVKKNWENGHTARTEERREERREELQRIRSRLFMGKQNKMREAYENAVAESEKSCVKRDVEVKAEKARLIKEKFEKGEVVHYEDSDEEAPSARKSSGVKDEDMDVFEAGISKKSRSLFQQMDAAVKTNQNQSKSTPANSCPPLRSHTPPAPLQNGQSQKVVMDRQLSSENVVRSSDPVDEVVVETADVSSKFKFFETYKPPEVKRKAFRITPPREGQLLQSNSPEKDVVSDGGQATRCEDNVEDESQLLKKSNTTAKMLSLFRQLEEAQQVVPDGPKPMKKFTPPPVSRECSSDEEDDDEESTDDEDSVDGSIIRASDKTEDEYLKLAQKAAKAKSLKEKFEKWQPEKQSSNNAVNLLDSEQASLDTTRSLTARFESFRNERQTTLEKPRPKVNRFV